MHKVILVLDYLLEIWRRVKLTHLPEKTTLKKSSLNRVKIKITQNSGYPNKEHNVIFEHIHQNNRAYPRSKKNLHWSMIGKMLLHPGKNPSKVRCRKTTRKILQFLLSFNEDGNSSTYTDAKLLYKHEHFFELNHKLGALQTCHAWKTILTNWQNMESKGPKKSQFLFGGRLCLNLSFTIKNKIRNLHKKVCSHFKHNEWDIPLPQIVRIYQSIGKKKFPLGKMEFWNHCKFCTYHRTFGFRKTWCLAL